MPREKRNEKSIDEQELDYPFTYRMVGRDRTRAWGLATGLAQIWKHATAILNSDRFRDPDTHPLSGTGMRHGHRVQ